MLFLCTLCEPSRVWSESSDGIYNVIPDLCDFQQINIKGGYLRLFSTSRNLVLRHSPQPVEDKHQFSDKGGNKCLRFLGITIVVYLSGFLEKYFVIIRKVLSQGCDDSVVLPYKQGVVGGQGGLFVYSLVT